MGKIQVDEFLQQFIAQNAEQLPAIIKFRNSISDEFLSMKATEGAAIAVLSAYKTIDTVQREAFAENTQPISCFTCKAAYCCHQTVEICEAEAAVIAQYCKEQKIKISRKYLQKQLAHNRDNIAFVDCSACVFLKDNKCSIYPVRPGACRVHHAATPFEFCDTKKYKHKKIAHANITSAQLIALVVLEQGGKVDRMQRLLLKYSQ